MLNGLQYFGRQCRQAGRHCAREPKYIRNGVGMAIEMGLGLEKGLRWGNKSLKAASKHFASYKYIYMYEYIKSVMLGHISDEADKGNLLLPPRLFLLFSMAFWQAFLESVGRILSDLSASLQFVAN